MKTFSRRSRAKSGAFSLAEVTTTMAVCAVLGAVLFPVFGKAIGKPGSCLSNQIQFKQACLLYSQDYDGQTLLPPRQLASYIKPEGFLACPAGEIPRSYLLTRTAARNQAGWMALGDLTYHGGPVMNNGSKTMAIFWGRKWGTPSFVGDKITGLDTWYMGFGNSNYAGTNTEYTDASNQHVSSSSTYLGHVIDTSRAPNSGGSTSQILSEVCSVLNRNGKTPDPNGFYAVYIDNPRRGAGYCAWHSAGTCNGVTIQFAFFFNLDGDGGCDPQSTVSGESQGLKALANVTGHELSEAVTDPHLNAWYDSNGAENSDKCAWTFGHPFVTFKNGSTWKIQGNYSNAANANSSGYDGHGCIDGG